MDSFTCQSLVPEKGTDTINDARTYSLNPWLFSQIINPRAGKEEHNNPIVHRKDEPIEVLRKDFKESMDLTDGEIRRYFTEDDFNTGRFQKISDDGYAAYESLGQCIQQYILSCGALNIRHAADLYSAATGMDTSPDELKKSGERVWNLFKVLNAREGFTREDDAFPSLWVKATETPAKFKTGDARLRTHAGKNLTKEDLERILDDYYDERGWDIETGVPTREKLEELGIPEFDGRV